MIAGEVRSLSSLDTAEEIVDRETRIEQFRGREIDFAPGRVVLQPGAMAGERCAAATDS
jgi:hypothetical protein